MRIKRMVQCPVCRDAAMVVERAVGKYADLGGMQRTALNFVCDNQCRPTLSQLQNLADWRA